MTRPHDLRVRRAHPRPNRQSILPDGLIRFHGPRLLRSTIHHRVAWLFLNVFYGVRYDRLLALHYAQIAVMCLVEMAISTNHTLAILALREYRPWWAKTVTKQAWGRHIFNSIHVPTPIVMKSNIQTRFFYFYSTIAIFSFTIVELFFLSRRLLTLALLNCFLLDQYWFNV